MLAMNGRKGPWSCEGSMPQCKGARTRNLGVGGLVSREKGEEIGDFQRGNWERG